MDRLASEHPLQLVARSSIFALLIGYAKPIFEIVLDIARAPYTALMDIQMSAEDFTFAGVEQVLMSGITTLVSVITVVGLILMLILQISLGWNYFKLLLEVVERYIVVGVLCYTSPLAYCMGGSKATEPVFKSWCRMVGSQLLLLVLNVWFCAALTVLLDSLSQTLELLQRTRKYLLMDVLCAGILKNSAKIRFLFGRNGLKCCPNWIRHGYGAFDVCSRTYRSWR